EVGKGSPGLLVDFADFNAPSDQFLTYGSYILYDHEQHFERTWLHGDHTRSNDDGTGRAGRSQLDKAHFFRDLLIKVVMKANLLDVKSFRAVNVRDGYRDQFKFHLHGVHYSLPFLYVRLLFSPEYKPKAGQNR